MKAQRPSFPGDNDPDVVTGEKAFAWILQQGSAEEVAANSRSQARRARRRRVFASFASATLLLATGATWRAFHPGSNFFGHTPAASAVIEAPQKKLLDDGSVVEMRDTTRLEVAYRTDERRIVLTEGEALFQVTGSAERPFVVRVGEIEIRALGTAFSVSADSGEVNVLVTEGTVRVDQALPTAFQPLAILTAGKRVTVALAAPTPATPLEAPPVESVSDEEIADLLAWRVPRVQFSNTPLEDAIRLVNRHSPIHLTLEDASLGRVQLSGSLRPDRVGPLLVLLRNDFGIDAEPNGENAIVLKKGQKNSRR